MRQNELIFFIFRCSFIWNEFDVMGMGGVMYIFNVFRSRILFLILYKHVINHTRTRLFWIFENRGSVNRTGLNMTLLVHMIYNKRLHFLKIVGDIWEYCICNLGMGSDVRQFHSIERYNAHTNTNFFLQIFRSVRVTIWIWLQSSMLISALC